MFWRKSDALDLIEMTYGMLDGEAQCHAFMERIQQLFGESMLCIQMWDGNIKVDNNRLVQAGFDTSAVTAYMDHFSDVNPYLPLLSSGKGGDVFTGSALIPKAVSSRHEFTNDFMYKLGNYEFVSAVILNDENRYGALSIDGPTYTEQHWNELFALIKVLTPHLQRVMHLSRRLHESDVVSTIACESMDRMASGMLVVDGSGRLVSANEKARQMLSGKDVLILSNDEVLSALMPDETKKLNALIASSTNGDLIGAGSAGGCMSLRTRSGGKMAAMITPLKRNLQKQLGLVDSWSAHKEYAAIFLVDPRMQARIPVELLMAFFNLTKTEAELAIHLFLGDSIADYCDRKYVTSNTARTQLKSIFNKTGVNRQGQLVALLSHFAVA